MKTPLLCLVLWKPNVQLSLRVVSGWGVEKPGGEMDVRETGFVSVRRNCLTIQWLGIYTIHVISCLNHLLLLLLIFATKPRREEPCDIPSIKEHYNIFFSVWKTFLCLSCWLLFWLWQTKNKATQSVTKFGVLLVFIFVFCYSTSAFSYVHLFPVNLLFLIHTCEP